jgi:hypothetical protein
MERNGIGEAFNIGKGTRQGGLTSPLLFNIFYKDLIDQLSTSRGGISIAHQQFNVFCYADDILLASTTVTGLQSLLSHANQYVKNHGLRFNPSKTKCVIYGRNPFCVNPVWYIDGQVLDIVDHVEYLGAFLGNNGGLAHARKRASSCRKSFHSLQAAGLCNHGLDTDTSMHVFKATCCSTLSYASDALHLSHRELGELDKTQSKLVKCIFGLNPRYRTTPLLQAVKLHKVSHVINVNTISLFHNVMKSNSAASRFNKLMLNGKCDCPKLLVNRVKKICAGHNVNFNYLRLSTEYMKQSKQKLMSIVKDGKSGVVDTIRHLVKHRTVENMSLLRLMLKAF